MVNGAFFVPSGGGAFAQYARASSLDPKSAVLIDQLTGNAGVFGDPRDNGDIFPGFSGGGGTVTGATSTGGMGSGGSGSSGDDGDFFGMIFKGSSSEAAPPSLSIVSTLLSLFIIFILYTFTNHGVLLSSL